MSHDDFDFRTGGLSGWEVACGSITGCFKFPIHDEILICSERSRGWAAEVGRQNPDGDGCGEISALDE